MKAVAAVWSDVWGAGGHDLEDASSLGVHLSTLAVGHCETNHMGLEIMQKDSAHVCVSVEHV
jgi:hypothetical protein